MAKYQTINIDQNVYSQIEDFVEQNTVFKKPKQFMLACIAMHMGEDSEFALDQDFIENK